MEADAYFLQVVQEFQWRHGGVEHDELTQIVDPFVVHNRKDKCSGFTFGGGKELVIRNFGCGHGFGLGLSHISGVICYRLVVDGMPCGCGGLGAIVLLVILLICDKAQHILDSLIHIVRER